MKQRYIRREGTTPPRRQSSLPVDLGFSFVGADAKDASLTQPREWLRLLATG